MGKNNLCDLEWLQVTDEPSGVEYANDAGFVYVRVWGDDLTTRVHGPASLIGDSIGGTVRQLLQELRSSK